MGSIAKLVVYGAAFTSAVYVSGKTYVGRTTYYSPSIGTGACGWSSTDEEYIVAVSPDVFGEHDNPNNAPVCGRFAVVQTADGLHSVRVKVTDKCPGCNTLSLDLSPVAFRQLADQGMDNISVVWFIDADDIILTTPSTLARTPAPIVAGSSRSVDIEATTGTVAVTIIQAGLSAECDKSFCLGQGTPGQYSLGACRTGFCKCGGGSQPSPQECPIPLVYDELTGACNWRADVGPCN